MNSVWFRCLFLVLSLGCTLSAQHVQAAKGGAGKVTVTNAQPATADQGQELDVYISGDGFDNGSTATFYVAGTSDDSQIFVESTVYEPSTGQLKSHIKVNGAALATDYDIEVKTAGGRRGKGTTLFKVQSVQTACTGSEPKEPTIVFLTSPVDDGTLTTQDLFLSSDSGCDQTLLMEDVVQVLPEGYDENPNRCLYCPAYLRIATYGNLGLATWQNDNRYYGGQDGVWFEYNNDGNIIPLSSIPEPLYRPQSGDRIWATDIRFNQSGEAELVFIERTEAIADRRLTIFNLQSGLREVVFSNSCPVSDSEGTCLEIRSPVFWGRAENEIYFSLYEPDPYPADAVEKRGVGRVRWTNGAWGQPELIMLNQGGLYLESVSSNGEVVYDYSEVLYTRGGKVRGSRRSFGVILPDYCISQPCTPSNGTDLGIERQGKGNLFLTPDGRGLVADTVNRGQDAVIQEFVDPYLGVPGRELILSVDTQFSTAR